MMEWIKENLATIAVVICAIGEAALIDYLWNQIRRMKEDPYDREWMDYLKWRQSRR